MKRFVIASLVLMLGIGRAEAGSGEGGYVPLVTQDVQLSELQHGTTVCGPDGSALGTIVSANGQLAIIRLAANSIQIPLTAFHHGFSCITAAIQTDQLNRVLNGLIQTRRNLDSVSVNTK